MPAPYKPVVLAIFDGWGVAPPTDGNAITRAKTPNFTEYLKHYPSMTVHASGNEVGLFFGEIGNSEVGHLNIGAGRIYYQSGPRLDQEISSGAFFTNQAFLHALLHCQQNKSALHLIGMLSSGNVHSSTSHLYALLDFCKKNNFKNVFVHVILDGRDCKFDTGKGFVEQLLAKMKELGFGQIASISGRYYAMDRDNRWPRVEQAYRAMAEGVSERKAEDPVATIQESYVAKVYDEEFVPTVITKGGQPVGTIKAGDSAIFYNFRPDRARELTKAFALPGFDKFKREQIKDLNFVTMMEYEKDLPVVVAYEPIVIHNCLAEVVSKAGKKQFHVAETEKYAHVTFFLNGTVEEPFPGEDRGLVPSPGVASYADVPEMSADKVTKKAIEAIDSQKYDFVVMNYANPDMVGHTGNIDATIKAVEFSDKCFGEIVKHTLANNGVVVMTADHGNAEEVANLQTGEIDKEHSTNAVPLIIIGKDFEGQAGPNGDAPEGDLSLMPPVGILGDVAPTVIKLLGLEIPPEMTGQPLI